MSSKTLSCAVGALAIAACSSLTEPTPANEPRALLVGYTVDTVLAFTSNSVGNEEIYTANADGGGVRRLTFNGGNRSPAFNGSRNCVRSC